MGLAHRAQRDKALRCGKSVPLRHAEHGAMDCGIQTTRGASGLLAQIFQHETDPLNGVLFTDKATNLREEPPRQAQEKK
ncbi:MAG: hypothetical protein A3D67_03100 [Candidatus Lloydbacteria bacterium RIFCSPHIGHO2_02_FULL_51_22]|uniref:Uncharacterized protein n=2 Tax=Candidatus Lloydiibacteriota TaxID=1817910 RepID=A0A1G2DBR7_9BACT|nr:MAG: hypothetical protein A3D67_03100 [Candidatus Lloydbacteria bacterium RIFCSPHIGHO2_02_FULL_51_22]OGZ14353.1 MAG: hypothetical protein A3J08_02255 [Candidatus Lloydbacteria bacterium RIFCSPLOWO2_02_FULL_51_11]